MFMFLSMNDVYHLLISVSDLSLIEVLFNKGGDLRTKGKVISISNCPLKNGEIKVYL